jgi:phosphoglycerol transferase
MPSVEQKGQALQDYGTAAAISIIAAVFLLELGKADLHVPFDYGGDGLLYALITKTTVEHGWFWRNPDLGAPGGFELYDFPASAHDSFHLLLIKLMSIFSSDWALLFNLYFLLGFPLIALSAMAVFRHFRVSSGPAIVGAVLYSFLPGRLLKGEGHIFMDVFYQVPLAILMLLWVCGKDPPLVRDREHRRWPGLEIRRGRSWGSLLICGLVASTSLYYAFFTTCLLVASGIWAAAERRSMRNAIAGIALAGVVVAGLAANAMPSLMYQRSHGANHAVAEREPWQAEVFGLKIAQLLLPADGHRLPALRELKERYNARAPLVGENSATSLGLVGDAGFLALIGSVLSRRRPEGSLGEPMRALSTLNLMAVLLGTIGGFGSLIALLITPQIRTYCRVGVLIGFFAIFAVVLLLERLRERRPRLAGAALPAVLMIGLLDQATTFTTRPYATTKKKYASDANLVHRIYAAVAPGAAIFELPYMSFPENPSIHHMPDYEPSRLYMHSSGLRWSYPTMRGRSGDAWVRDVSQYEPSRMGIALTAAGFGGILIIRDGYADNGCAIEAGFRSTLGVEPLVSQNGDLAFFSLTRCPGRACEMCGASNQPCCGDGTCGGGTLCHDGRCQCGKLESGQTLASGQAMASCDGRFSLIMEGNGNLVLRGCNCPGPGGSCWSSNSSGHPGSRLEMQPDGNLVVSGSDCVADTGCWSPGPGGHPGDTLLLQNDGNMCVVGPGCTGPNGTCWCSNTCCH